MRTASAVPITVTLTKLLRTGTSGCWEDSLLGRQHCRRRRGHASCSDDRPWGASELCQEGQYCTGMASASHFNTFIFFSFGRIRMGMISRPLGPQQLLKALRCIVSSVAPRK